jgi:putative membrane protein
MTIEGLLEYEAVRDFLYSRMRGAREHPAVAEGGESSLTEALQSIASELRGIRRLLEERGRV